MRIQLVAFDGVEALDLIGPYETLEIAHRFGGDLDVSIVSLEGIRALRASHGLRYAAIGKLGDPRPDVVIVPGGGWTSRDESGIQAEIQNGLLPRTLQTLKTDGVTIAAVSTGALILAFAGFLKDRRATTHRSALEYLRAMGALITAGRVVDDGDILTTAGGTAGIDLALNLIERYLGAELVERVATYLEYARARPTT